MPYGLIMGKRPRATMRPPYKLQRMTWTASLYLYAHMLPLYCRLDCVNGRAHQAGLFSGVLTSFIIDRYQNLQPSPTQQSAYFLQQSTMLLNQISHQLSSLGAQYPSNLSLPGPTFNPSGSDVRVNIYWFSSLVSSLSAALLATLVQRWARDHMHIFHRYSDPSKLARIRQYLYEGAERWYMPASAEAVPGLIHISLFLFFIGLADFLLSTYSIVGKFALFPISLCIMFYIFSTIAPLINPQSPYRTSFSGFAWHLAGRLRKRWYKGHFDGLQRPLSLDLADGRMQLAMERNPMRKDRDEHAIIWLLNNLGEDIEMESLASRFSGSIKRGAVVWRTSDNSDPRLLARRSKLGTLLSNVKQFFHIQRPDDSLPRMNLTLSPLPHHPIPSPSRPLDAYGDAFNELFLRFQRLFETCNHHDSFLDPEEWRKRSRICVEIAASFIFRYDIDVSSFKDIGKLLSDLGGAERTHEVSRSDSNWSLISCWTSLSIMHIRRSLNSLQIRRIADQAILTLGIFDDADDVTPAYTAPSSARKMDEQFVAAWDLVEKLCRAFNGLSEEDRREGRIEEILLLHKPELEQIRAQADRMRPVDVSISTLQNQIDQVTHNLIRRLPGVAFDQLTGPTPLSHVFDFLAGPAYPQLLHLSPRLLGLCSLSDEHIETTEVLKAMKTPIPRRSVMSQYRVMERQLWRLEDLGIGAFGFTLELYFLSLRQILPTFTSRPSETHVLFYISAFKVITSDWEQFKRSRGTLQIVLNLVIDIAVRDRGIFSNFEYPSYIRGELLGLLDAMVKGEPSPYIDDAMAELNNVGWRTGNEEFLNHASRIIQGSRMYVS